MADFNGTGADDRLDGTGEADRLFGGNGDDLLVGGEGDDTAVFETGRSGFVVTSPLPDVLVVSEASGLSAGNGTDVLSGVETLAFGSNALPADEALRAFAPRPGSEAPAFPSGVERLLADYEAAGDWSPPAGGEPERVTWDDGLQAVHESSGLSWDEIGARVLANFEATGHWYF